MDLIQNLAQYAGEQKVLNKAESARLQELNTIGLTESLDFKLNGKHEKVRANYPKTNVKRYADEWNDKVGKWASVNAKAGHALFRRTDTPAHRTVIDAYDDNDKLLSTMVATDGGDLFKDYTIDFYNHAAGDNAYSDVSGPKAAWKFKKWDISSLHSSDQRNLNVGKATSIADRGRQKDGGASLQALARSSRK